MILLSNIIKFIAIFNPKVKLFQAGQKNIFKEISSKIKTLDKSIWFHVASLGEYEQGLPVIKKIKILYPNHKIILTFFSPSGYEVKKNNNIANCTIYLPIDIKKNAIKFLNLVHPDFVFFIKYEFWPNYLFQLKKFNIPTYLISGIFRENQLFFKWYGGYYRRVLQSFTYFFVQNQISKKLLHSIGYKNAIVSGDTRYDQVMEISKTKNSLNYIKNFKDNKLLVVIGSTWIADEKLLTNYINKCTTNVKYIIAPHNVNKSLILNLKNNLTKNALLYSEKEIKKNLNYDVLIIDTIGILSKIYSFADISFVGGGFGNPGVHNILEPAIYGIPIIIGSNFSHFIEAKSLVDLGGCISISNQKELNDALDLLISDKKIRDEKGFVCSNFVMQNTGASDKILDYIKQNNPAKDLIYN